MIAWLIRKRKVTIMFFLMFTIVGVLSFLQLPQREIPETNLAIAQVSTVYPGASASQVEQQITNELETNLNQIDEIETLTSVSSPGFSFLTIQLQDGLQDQDQVWNEVRQRITNAQEAFPEDAFAPQFNNDLSVQGLATYQLTFESAEHEQMEEVQQVLNDYQNRLSELPNIVSFESQGLREKEIRIEVDAESLQDAQISTDQLLGVLFGEVSTTPPGEWQQGAEAYYIELETNEDMSDLENLPLGASPDGDILRVGDVATIVNDFEPAEEKVRFAGEEALALTFYLKEGASVTSTQNQLTPFVDELAADLPEGVQIELLYTQADLVQELFRDLAISFAIAVGAVLLVCSLGLNPSTSLSVALAIPISLSIGSILLPFAGVDLNQISLIAFIIALTILVDDGIVINENIDRRRRLGDGPFEAAVNGTKEVSISVITSTLTVAFTFLPLLLLPGAAGEFAKPLPIVLISTVVASTFFALMLVPIYRMVRESRLEKKQKQVTRRSAGLLGPAFDKVADFYSEKLMRGVTKKPVLVVIVGFALGTAAYVLIPWIPLEFFPDTDRNEVFVEMSLPEGSTLEATEEQALELEQWFNEQSHVESVTTYLGTEIPALFGAGGGGVASSNQANFFVFIDRTEKTTRETMNEWNERLPEEFDGLQFNATMIESGPPVGAPIAIEISGDSIERLMELSEEVQKILENTDGVLSVEDDVGEAQPAYRFVPDRTALEENAVTSEDLAEALRLVGEGIPVGQLQQGNELLDMRLVFSGVEQEPADVLSTISVTGQTGQATLLEELVTVEETTIEPKIPHKNSMRTITVRAYPGDRSADDILADATGEIEEAVVDEERYAISIGGETSQRTDVFIDIGKIFIVVIFLILIVLVIQFYSLTIPLIIFSTVYLAIAGALLGLFITQTGLGFMSMMGAVSLAGVVVRNGIVLIEFIEQRRAEGMDVQEAVIQAANQRFRPIILTTLTSIAGLMPIALGNNTLFKPLGITIVSGIAFSAVLTLFIVPALYLMQNRWRKGKEQKQLIGFKR